MARTTTELAFSRINRILVVFIVLCNSFVILTPFMPEVSFQLRRIQPRVNIESTLSTIDPAKNWLIIPELNMKESILEGQSIQTVNEGVWRRPNTSEPGQGSNTVLVGHRFTYEGASVFYHLDKLDVADHITIVWEGSAQLYEIREKKVVPASAIEIEDPTSHETLTLYTCTPLWSTENRLVIIAEPVGNPS